jgi:acetylornithine deacetylase/succinyl-diaminopimelate desuccinylase-like protein
VRCDHAIRRSRDQCLAAAGHREHQLPHLSGRVTRVILAQLVKLAADPAVKVTIPEVRGPIAAPTPLTPRIMKPIEKLADEIWPGVPVVPVLEPGASDAQFYEPRWYSDLWDRRLLPSPDGGNIHGLNERIRVKSVYEGRTFLYRLVKLYADQ